MIKYTTDFAKKHKWLMSINGSTFMVRKKYLSEPCLPFMYAVLIATSGFNSNFNVFGL